ncbi:MULTISPECIES: ECF RNA polymerase sigma factor SigK [Allobranchiibius]|uniref:RNA polymerase sigma-70 factor (ECF subfamily) n=1 Tax=Allobranchiibius huperziae TaxID=1874116 RepID=A0A853DG20_9MICO|nr:MULTISPECIES: ECF RNA polymerase sigma factor SigK [Allobranchiibius]NYJ75637.1 RNA polymerase sigma-70 factor (ECF subfamily) [Allobranchiibius huperziae]UIJ36218.1 ECF RNA polymerase sigma factor SigK [Allobranchiibius sp. GilTou73]
MAGTLRTVDTGLHEPGPELADLLTAAGRGDEDAFARLYDATSPRINGLVVRLIVDRAQAEEITQEVFLEIWRTSPKFDPQKGSALSWMFTLAHRRAVDRIRSAQATRRRDETYTRESQETAYDSTVDQVTASLDAERVRSALGTLGENQRQALSLVYFEGHTHAEVAERLGIPLGTAKTRIRDGLQRLRTAMGGER